MSIREFSAEQGMHAARYSAASIAIAAERVAFVALERNDSMIGPPAPLPPRLAMVAAESGQPIHSGLLGVRAQARSRGAMAAPSLALLPLPRVNERRASGEVDARAPSTA